MASSVQQAAKAHPYILFKSYLHERFNVAWLQDAKARGFYGAEVRIDLQGDEESDARQLRDLNEWVKPWIDAGLAIYIHPYTRGSVDPAATDEAHGSGGAPVECFQRVADFSAELAERTGEPVNLTYHAAGARTSETGENLQAQRDTYAARSIHFFNNAFHYLTTLGNRVTLTSETQLPTYDDEPRIRIGDRPDEVIATAQAVPQGICWDTGHYLIATMRVGAPLHPVSDLVNRVSHMHVHDVIQGRDHRALTVESEWVAYYVGLAASTGFLKSITLEYDYADTVDRTVNADEALDHYTDVKRLVLGWAANPTRVMPTDTARMQPLLS